MSDVPIAVLREHFEEGKVKDVVAGVCERYPSCRGDYRLLLWRVWRAYGLRIDFKTFEQIRSAPSPETVSRRFRELKEEEPEKYAASFETECKRSKNEKVFRSYYGRKNNLTNWCL